MSNERTEIRTPWIHLMGDIKHNSHTRTDVWNDKSSMDVYIPSSAVAWVEKCNRCWYVYTTNDDIWTCDSFSTKCI